jgi:DNA-binding beta-propeller fold protein YncE
MPIGICVNGKTNIAYVSEANSDTLSVIDNNKTAQQATVPEFESSSLIILVVSVTAAIVFTRFKIMNTKVEY